MRFLLLRRLLQGDQVLFQRQYVDGAVTRLIVRRPLPLIMLVALVGLTILWPSRVWLVLLAGLGFVIGGCLLWMRLLATRLRLSRQLIHTWRQVGDRLEESFSLRNDTFLPALAVELSDESNLPGYAASTVRSVPPNETRQWASVAISQRRGLFRLGPAMLRYNDPFGLFEVEQTHPRTREILVYPPILHHMRVSLPPGGGHGERLVRRRTLEETAAVSSVRDYAPGDPIRRIHWPLSMRHSSLLVKEFDRDVGGDVWVVLDLYAPDHAGQGAASTLEETIVRAATVTWHLIRQGGGVGLFTFGTERIVLPPARGSAQAWRVLRALAPLSVQPDRPLSVLLSEANPLIRRGHALKIITPSTSPDWLEVLLRPSWSAVSREVILVDPSLFVEDISPAGSEALRALLIGHGIPVQVVGPEGSRLAVPAAPGSGDWEFKVTGFGKVIVRSRPERVGS